MSASIASRSTAPAEDGAHIFFAFGGLVVSIALAITGVSHWTGGALTLEWLAIGALAPLYPLVSAVRSLWPTRQPGWLRPVSTVARFALGIVFLAAATKLAFDAHRLFLTAIAVAQVVLVWNVSRKIRKPSVTVLALIIATFVAWVMTTGLTYVPLSDFFLDSARSTSFGVLAFVGALVLAVIDFSALDFSTEYKRSDSARVRQALILASAALVFLELSLRTDGLWTDWVPYHRSYFTGPVAFVHQGHWLLWDVPSQYGFLSVIALALTPGRTIWQSAYILTAILLTLQTTMLFLVLRAGRHGAINAFFAALVASAVFLSDQAFRWPYGPRAYPQHGLRFFWIYALLFVIFQIYANRTNARWTRRLTVSGNIAWSIGCFWSFESAVWCSIVWVAYRGTSAVVAASREHGLGRKLRVVSRLADLPALIGVWIVAIESFYAIRLGHAPDWLSYFEFSGIYLIAAPYAEQTDVLGPVWLIVLLLTAVGSTLVLAARTKKWELMPYFVSTWAAVWGVSLYFAGETFNDHVNSLVGFFAFAAATITYVALSENVFDGSMLLARVSFIPMLVILMATCLGQMPNLAKLRAPFLPNYHADITDDVRPISGELADLMRRADIEPSDPIILPDGVGWSKIDTGEIVPLARDGDGIARDVIGWLPLGPAGPSNAFYTLPPDRRLEYTKRFLATSNDAGWYITFHQEARCDTLSPRAYGGRTWTSRNFSATRCKLRPERPNTSKRQ